MNDPTIPLRRYADFSGRSRRREFWSWTLLVMLVELILFGWIAWASAGSGGRMTTVVSIPFIVLLIFGLVMLTPSLAVTVRRLHDRDWSGAWILIALVPIVGALALLILMALEGTRGPNRYGADPKVAEQDRTGRDASCNRQG